MPHSELHEKQRKKNIALVLVLIGLMAIVFTMAMIRVPMPNG